MNNTHGILHKLATTVVLSLAVSGCSLFNPYVDTTAITYPPGQRDGTTPCRYDQPAVNQVGMEKAMKCALALQGEYIDNMGDQALLSSVSGVSLIALTAYTTSLAIDGNNTSKVTDFALGTAALYGMSQWLSQPERSRIYGLGAKAVQCAIESTIPFQAVSGEELGGFREAIGKLSTSAEGTRTALAAVDQLIASEAPFTSTQQARAHAESSRQLIASADSTIAQAQGLVKLHLRAPFELKSSLQGINATVNLGLADTIQSLNALPGTLSNVLAMYGKTTEQLAGLGFSAAPAPAADEEPAAQSAEDEAKQAENDASLKGLQKEAATLAANLAVVKPKIVLFSPELPEGAARECGVDLSSFSRAVTLSPDKLTFASDTAPTLSVKASGGGGSYVVTFDANSLEITQTQPFGDTLQVKPKTGAAGTYFVTVMDIGGNQGVLPVQVSASSGGEAKPGDEEDQPEDSVCEPMQAKKFPDRLTEAACRARFTGMPADFELSDAEKTLCTDGDITVNLQLKLKAKLPDGSPHKNLCHDGFYGPATRAAILEVRRDGGAIVAESVPVGQAHIDQIMDRETPP